MGKEVFRWAFLGAGNIAHTTADELKKSGKGEVVSIWNRTESKAISFAKQFGCKAYPTPLEAISDPAVQGVYIAVNADRHAEFMKLCIKAHKPVLCEKPFTVNRKEAIEVFSLAEKEGVYVSEAMWTWHNQTANQVKKWIDEGKIGKILEAKGSFSWPVLLFNKNPRLTENSMIGGSLMDLGVYPIAYAYRLFGMPKGISCQGQIRNEVDLHDSILLSYPSFFVKLKAGFNRMDGEYFKIKGSKGSINVPLFHMAKKAILSGEKKEKIQDDSYLYAVQFENVGKEILLGEKESRFVPKQMTIDVMGILDECRRQMKVVYPGE